MVNNSNKYRLYLLLTQIYVHLWFVLGLLVFSWELTIPVIIINQIIFVGLCGTVFYHRVVTHKNPIIPWVEKLLLMLSWVGASGSAIAWAGTHRAHHRYSDTERDPHSAKYIGVIKTYWWSSGNNNIIRYVPDLLRKKLYLFQHNHYFSVLIILHILGIILLPASVYWAVLITPAFLMWFAGSMINVMCHDDHGPRNVTFLGYVHAGEGWHKNHHDQGSSASFNHRFDWGHWIYRLIEKKIN